MKTGVLRTRIIWSTALVALVAMAAMIATVVLVLNAVTRNNAESTLEERLAVISAAIASSSSRSDGSDDSGSWTVPPDSIDDSSWLYESGVLLDGPTVGAAVQEVADSLSQVTTKSQITRAERLYLASPVELRDDPEASAVLVVSLSLEPYESTRTELVLVLVGLGLAVSAGVTAVAAWTVSRTMAPVLAMADLAEEWSERDLDARFADADAHHEIGHLGRTLNILLDRVAGALRSEQRLTAELAHELRTPLTGIRGEVELALGEPIQEQTRPRLERMLLLVDQMSGTISTLLSLARGEAAARQGVPVDVLIRNVLEGQSWGDLDLVVDSPSNLRVGASPELALRALAPLVENAIRYAAKSIKISARAQDRMVRIAVSDDGPGLEPTVAAEGVLSPGTRAPDSPGAGLGLALAHRVAHTVGGEVSVGRAGSPTIFVLTLPQP